MSQTEPPSAARASSKSAVPLGAQLSDWQSGKKYTLVRLLGRGTTCKCIEAMTDSGECVALKLTSVDCERARKCNPRERAALLKCDHPNIVRWLGAFTRFNYHIAVLEHGGGATLKTLASAPNMHAARAAFPQMCAALAYLKRVKLLHRDVKLDNFAVDVSKRSVKLCDFGMALSKSKSHGSAWSGTPLYAAPELVGRWDGVAHFGYPSEAWALGVCLYRLAQGEYPFNGKDAEELADVLLSAKLPEPIADAACDDVCSRLLDKASERRMMIEDALEHPFGTRAASAWQQLQSAAAFTAGSADFTVENATAFTADSAAHPMAAHDTA